MLGVFAVRRNVSSVLIEKIEMFHRNKVVR